ncbi:Potassium channel protein-like OS=Blastopirellula marina DSM 3645 GN=DSM3645_09777 PE=4 SV=1 [Gemmataceae bacterium]|nr:Potassium channel protein-like OS=Blastopirellula marina DSM 3645 GN=DSM3645_09777 PE=4 SV=1 [Gemmataceae bacterium]VTT96905.1 Potassium channel protein-like OS=Blastopirellula marina DSM 3645 GN=DSM3645_09777 PE=4 SV=1 [Gemmataceae bacterium]
MSTAPPTGLATLRAGTMFALGFAFLVLAAGLIHRGISGSVTHDERQALTTALLAMWPVFVLEAAWGVLRRDRTKPLPPVLWRVLVVCVMPPWRMALPDPRTGLIWVPRVGWHEPGKELSERLEHAFAGPMVLVALMILPVLGLEYLRADEVRATPWLAVALDASIAVIWVAFAAEFVLKASAHPKPLRFARENWLDLAIVALPVMEFALSRWHAAPLARLLRAGQALSPEQLARMERLYRLRGVATEGWHALLLLNVVARLLGQTPERRLARVREKIAELEEEIRELEHDAAALRDRVAGAPPAPAQNQPDTRSGGATGKLPSDAVTATSRPSGP